ncbi:MAG: T9SS type A sorting domain-containing protein [Bacteroidetes bacterium]|nr:T9SS type A sorting domain-containing protein [Bacteroidota bacterium]
MLVFWNTCTNTWVSPSCILQGTPPTNLNNTPIICTNNGSGSARLSNTSPISEVKISNQPFIYPNPTSGKLNINLNLENAINGYNVSIFSVDGKNIYNNTVNETLEAGTIINNEFDISNQANGIYFIRVTSENNLLLNQKFVLNK